MNNEPEAFEEFDELRNEFDLQEISFYRPDFSVGQEATYYIGPDITHNQRVQQERERLVIDALEADDVITRLIIGSPESQIAGAIPVFGNDNRDNWSQLGVVLVAYHVNDNYILGLSEILNVEAILINQEQEIVARTLEESPQELLLKLQLNYSNTYGSDLFSNSDDVYLDYIDVEGDTLRIIQHTLIIDDEVEGYLLVGRSFNAVLSLQQQIANTFFLFSGGILGVIVVLLIVLIGIPALRNRSQADS